MSSMDSLSSSGSSSYLDSLSELAFTEEGPESYHTFFDSATQALIAIAQSAAGKPINQIIPQDLPAEVKKRYLQVLHRYCSLLSPETHSTLIDLCTQMCAQLEEKPSFVAIEKLNESACNCIEMLLTNAEFQLFQLKPDLFSRERITKEKNPNQCTQAEDVTWEQCFEGYDQLLYELAELNRLKSHIIDHNSFPTETFKEKQVHEIKNTMIWSQYHDYVKEATQKLSELLHIIPSTQDIAIIKYHLNTKKDSLSISEQEIISTTIKNVQLAINYLQEIEEVPQALYIEAIEREKLRKIFVMYGFIQDIIGKFMDQAVHACLAEKGYNFEIECIPIEEILTGKRNVSEEEKKSLQNNLEILKKITDPNFTSEEPHIEKVKSFAHDLLMRYQKLLHEQMSFTLGVDPNRPHLLEDLQSAFLSHEVHSSLSEEEKFLIEELIKSLQYIELIQKLENLSREEILQQKEKLFHTPPFKEQFLSQIALSLTNLTDLLYSIAS